MIARLLWIAAALLVLGEVPGAAPAAPSARGAPRALAPAEAGRAAAAIAR